ncbi:hypothetical protein GCM10022381_25980 [Leifsonia kafniensis]|uniref:Calcineurin-like phosphoesterase domain-containing protein n=1 Tax=Leifsonia kafniensis TaxID=475957 RepID=A0ABP7KQE4_9MICO
MHLIVDLAVPGIDFTSRRTTSVAAIDRVANVDGGSELEFLLRHKQVTQQQPLSFDLTLPGEERVAVAGDWHGSFSWVQKAIPALHRMAPEVRTILQLGDFGIWRERAGKGFSNAVDYWCRVTGIDRVLVTPGNHEDWDLLDAAFETQPGEAVQLSKTVWVLPRGYRFELAGRSFMSFGGAASLDFAHRVVGKSWWPAELPTEDDVGRAVAGGSTEVLLTHETVNGGAAETEQILSSNPFGWSMEALAYAAESRAHVTGVWDAVSPAVLAHGHFHVKGEIERPDGRRVYSLGADNDLGNLALLSLDDLSWTWIEFS